MRTLVISGGTDGMGRALARTYLGRGDTVVVIGRDRSKALPGAVFIPADLSLISENLRVIDEINAKFPVVDALVLCARFFRTHRFVTAEGVEGTFALDYLSRFLLSYGLTAPRLIVNVSGPGEPTDLIRWNDLMLERRYDGMTAQFQAGKANDLLGVAFAARHGSRTRYVLMHPKGVSTSVAGEYDAATAAHVEALKRYGLPVEEGIKPIVARLDDPPAEPLSAFIRERRIALGPGPFDPAAAERLHELTLKVIDSTGNRVSYPL
ncbi:SDR family NAD(P)-dependent oxidoreductase [Nonomuraea jabiensis]|uniref:NAD(P)-dependent dehydrogenase (Short-subunit alcohol dehydrogenase family) n=1 Tax=Nonomuraea jabiensis TaxID=882448 RepID=A0A7W9G007_9ACTN|nr:SDR family NAD(P)-dependent oxidoreductase [Nonomuraea jabiensis]MBB5774694.1 NAD(P)-dependent dehydrogenase (short-subunit alcohol dehydrogenase family) [Nonomuraea jabiensis]